MACLYLELDEGTIVEQVARLNAHNVLVLGQCIRWLLDQLIFQSLVTYLLCLWLCLIFFRLRIDFYGG